MASGTQSLEGGVHRSRQLDFSKAMSDFKLMFPSVDYDVIEMVLRANNGLVDATVDQLLAMQEEDNSTEHKLLDPDLNVRLPGYNDSSSVMLANEPPPAYTPRAENYHQNFQYDSTFLEPELHNFSNASSSHNTPISTKPNHWNPPLLGSLPNDFLRLNVNDKPSVSTSWQAAHTPVSSRNGNYDRDASWTRREPTGTRLRNQVDNPSYASPVVNGFDAIPDSESKPAKCSGNKNKSKKLGQMSRKFKRKKTKTTKSNYQQISSDNLIDEASGDEQDAQR